MRGSVEVQIAIGELSRFGLQGLELFISQLEMLRPVVL